MVSWGKFLFELMALSDLITLKLWTKLDWKIAARPRQKPKARGEWVKYIFKLSNLLSMGISLEKTFCNCLKPIRQKMLGNPISCRGLWNYISSPNVNGKNTGFKYSFLKKSTFVGCPGDSSKQELLQEKSPPARSLLETLGRNGGRF